MSSTTPQMPPGLSLHLAIDRPDLWDEARTDPTHELWIWLRDPWNNGSSRMRFWKEIEELDELKRYQAMVVRDSDNAVVATANCVPFFCPELAKDSTSSEWFSSLPDGGWDTILARGVRQAQAREGVPLLDAHLWTEGQRRDSPVACLRDLPNALSGLYVQVSESYRGLRIADVLLANFKELARRNNLKAVVVPLRPTLKCKYQSVRPEQYFSWVQGKPNESGFTWSSSEDPDAQNPLPFDPWLRKHIQMGARVAKIAPESFQIEGTAAQWQQWLVQENGLLNETVGEKKGQIALSGENVEGKALDWFNDTVKWDPKTQTGRYLEADIWVVHDV
ncbi:hypothetical protein N7519_008527 [Penicillium mononematosum]|uniref:uncharacterized protein n=1 Tax=Penicillium mononematosum TaxID=268346 RepID=UPI002546EB4E|nr:uncharacterized protein N7519_008527 [Penicillium mononematosum]KAJ6178066.1 hypothetical protein N7519_008527 [Penicillium mononematosum]